jgi:pseudouridine kinase
VVVNVQARNRVVCAGNAGLDRTFAVIGPVHLATSNPSHVRAGFGGVARNVAENLARLGVPVALATQVGDDEAGRSLIAGCSAVGIDVRGVRVSATAPTGEYIAVIDAQSELVIGASETAAIDALTVETLAPAFADDGRTAWTFADCNLPAPVLGALIAHRRADGHRLAIDAVSIAKVQRLPRDLRGIDVLFLNADEARTALADEEAEIEELARALRLRGAAAVVLTRGALGAHVAFANGVADVPVPPSVPVDVTGAGDALIAGTLFGLLDGEALPAAVATGTLVAAMTIEAPTTVARTLSRAAVDAQRARLAAHA